MPEKPISLSKFRKAKARQETKAQADANALKFGRSKAERTRDAKETARIQQEFRGHKREDPDD